MDLDKDFAEALALGGGLLGAGGGGSWREGLQLMETAVRIGRPRLVAIDDMAADATLATVSGVGAPAATDQDVRVSDHLGSLELFMEQAGSSLAGLITSENGGFSSANGFVQSALSGLPVVDAPGNGRAHPTGVMGSMGLHNDPVYHSKQAAVGGAPGRFAVRLYVEGSLPAVDHVVRQAAVAAGGLVAVTRNPVPAEYVRQHGAPGALGLAADLGRIIRENRQRGGVRVAERVLEHFGVGEIVACGEVHGYELRTEGGYDVGSLAISKTRTTFWNEFMTVDVDDRRVATFPDLVFALDEDSGLPVTTAEVGNGVKLVLARVPKEYVPLGAGVKDRKLIEQVAHVIGEPMTK